MSSGLPYGRTFLLRIKQLYTSLLLYSFLSFVPVILFFRSCDFDLPKSLLLAQYIHVYRDDSAEVDYIKT
jgi:hypothetical protein